MPLVTFIVPTIGRDSLVDSINSLLAQTDDDWEALIVGDGQRAQKYLQELPWYDGGKLHFGWFPETGSAGATRNLGFKMLFNPENKYSAPTWVAFLDDDDTLEPTYVEHLREQAEDYPWADVIIARMMDKKLGGVLPRFDSPRIAHGNVGISFAVKRNVIQHRKFVSEERMKYVNEDWEMIKALKADGARIHISPHVDYLVRGGK